MSEQRPGLLRRLAYLVFRWIPPRPSHAIIRLATPTFSVGAIALVEHDGRVLALEQTHRHGMSLPGGLVSRGEQPAQTVVREVLEETGLVIDAGDVCATVFEVQLRHIDVVFRVLCDHEPVVHPASEATAYAWLGPGDWGEPDRATMRILDAAAAAHRTPRLGRLLD